MVKRLISLLTAVLMTFFIPFISYADLKDASLDGALNAEGGTIVFVSEGAYPWAAAVSDDPAHASFGKCGNSGIHSSTSVMSASVTVGEDGAGLSFDYQSFGEISNYGYVVFHCIFKIDGV